MEFVNFISNLTAEITRCSCCFLVSADLLPQAKDKAVLQVAEYRGADLDELFGAVSRHNLGIVKGHKTKNRKPQRLYINCSRGEKCVFRINALLVDGVGLRIIKFQ